MGVIMELSIEKKTKLLKEELKKRNGLFLLAPCFVARNFMHPGRRLKLDPRDYYAMGAAKGGIDERWFASTTPADNGEYTIENEGLSFVVIENSSSTEQILFKEAVELLGDEIIGQEQMNKYGKWMMYAKFFDNMGPIAHHVHLMDYHAEKVNMLGKPEGYYFPVQQNNVFNNFPHTYFGLNPDTKKEQVIDCLKKWETGGDNGILDLSRAFRLEVGTGWDVPPGILHAPGSLLTYEPQRASDVSIFFQNIVEGRYNTRFNLVKDIPEKHHYDYDYLIDILDWELNIAPDFKERHHLTPKLAKEGDGYYENWVVYGANDFCAKELHVKPKSTVIITDSAAYGFILIQGHGKVNGSSIDSPTMIRFGQLTSDEMFVNENAALKGVTITNESEYGDLVMLKHFGPDNIDAKHLSRSYK